MCPACIATRRAPRCWRPRGRWTSRWTASCARALRRGSRRRRRRCVCCCHAAEALNGARHDDAARADIMKQQNDDRWRLVSERQDGGGRRRRQDERADTEGTRPRARRAGERAGRTEERAPRKQSARPPQPPPAFSYEALAAVERFAAAEPFPLDPFQLEAARHLADRRSVLVAAPTGTGKTVVAEFAIWQARGAGQRAIYTAPLKALSNQKFRDFRVRYGASEVGLLTGDIVENPRAPIVVMTTEIYRNMLLEGLRAARTPPVEVEAAALVQPLAERVRAADDGMVAADDVAELAPPPPLAAR